MRHRIWRIGRVLVPVIVVSFLAGMLTNWLYGERLDPSVKTTIPVVSTGPGSPPPTKTTLRTIIPITPAPATAECTLPVGPERETLVVSLMDSGGTDASRLESNLLTAWIEYRTEVHLEFLVYPRAAESAEQLSVTGDSIGDVSLMPLSRLDLYQYANEVRFLPMNRLIPEHAPHIQAMLDTQPGMINAYAALDGGLYGLPPGRDESVLYPDDLGMRMWIHRGFLDRYGRGMPQTTEEFRDFLVWVRDADANGNGDPSDEIGWIASMPDDADFARPTDFVMNAFTLQNEDGFYVSDGTVHCAMVEDGWREGLRYLTGLMDENLLDPESLTQPVSDFRERVSKADGESVACVSVSSRRALSGVESIREKYVPLLPLRGPSGLANAYRDGFAGLLEPGTRSAYTAASRDAQVCFAMISSACSRPERAMSLLDILYEDETLLRARLGAPGIDWWVPPADLPTVTGRRASVQVLNHTWSAGTKAHWFLSFPTVSRIEEALPFWTPYTQSDIAAEYEAAQAYEPYVIPCSVPPLGYDPATAVSMMDWERRILQVCRVAALQYIVGMRDIGADADWTAYISVVRAAGLDECLETMQTAYDARWRGIA